MVIWVPKKSAEFGFVAEVDQREVDETADTLVGRGHGPKVSLLDNFQLDMGGSKYIYIVGHSAGKAVSGYTGEQMLLELNKKGLRAGLKFKVMACNVGQISGFVKTFLTAAVNKGVEMTGVDRIVYYTNDNKFLYTDCPPFDTDAYHQDDLRRAADTALKAGTWDSFRTAIKANPALLLKLSPFYQRFGIKAPAVQQAIQKQTKDGGVAFEAVVKTIDASVLDASPKLAYDLRDFAAANGDFAGLRGPIDAVFLTFRQKVDAGWEKKKEYLRTHQRLDKEPMTGPQRLKHVHDKGAGPLRPYLTQ